MKTCFLNCSQTSGVIGNASMISKIKVLKALRYLNRIGSFGSGSFPFKTAKNLRRRFGVFITCLTINRISLLSFVSTNFGVGGEKCKQRFPQVKAPISSEESFPLTASITSLVLHSINILISSWFGFVIFPVP